MNPTERSEPGEISPLIAIRQKELEIAERLAAARQAAEQAILDAHRTAAERRARAESEGHAAAAAFLHSELDAADADAAKLRGQGERAATQIAQGAAQALEPATQRIVEYVLPRLPAG